MHKLELNKIHEITSKIQALRPQILHKTVHGKRMLGSKKEKHSKAMVKKI